MLPPARLIGFNGAAVVMPRKGLQTANPFELLSSFNGAAVVMPRKARIDQGSRRGLHRFNGAAVVMPRKAEQGSNLLGVVSASMGPRW